MSADRSLARECADASVLPMVGAAILTFLVCTAGSVKLGLSVGAMVSSSIAAFALYVAALAHAQRMDAEREGERSRVRASPY